MKELYQQHDRYEVDPNLLANADIYNQSTQDVKGNMLRLKDIVSKFLNRITLTINQCPL